MRVNLTIVASLRFRLKEICVGICTSGKASVHLLFIFSVIEAAYKVNFLCFSGTHAFKNNRSGWNMQNLLRVR